MTAVIMFVMVPRAAVSAGRIREVLDTEPTDRRPAARRSAPHPPRRRSSSATSSSATRAPRSRSSAHISFDGRPGRDDGDRRLHRQRQVHAHQPDAALLRRDRRRGARRRRRRPRAGPPGPVAADRHRSRRRRSCSAAPIASNLRYGDEEATDEELWHALDDRAGPRVRGRDAGAGSRRRSPRAARTSRAASASGSRSPARSSSEPDVYVFDDSFSALDFRTDARLRAALGRELGDATVIIVAQRVGTILHADRIVVLDDGRGRRHRHPRRADADLRDLPRDRPVPGHRGGGRMSGPTPAARRRARRRAGRRPAARWASAAAGRPAPAAPARAAARGTWR